MGIANTRPLDLLRGAYLAPGLASGSAFTWWHRCWGGGVDARWIGSPVPHELVTQQSPPTPATILDCVACGLAGVAWGLLRRSDTVALADPSLRSTHKRHTCGGSGADVMTTLNT